ncbi:MAG: amidohydrolase [Lachnospiraceae bacterium]
MDATYILKSSAIFDSISDTPVAGGVVINDTTIAGVYPESELAQYTGPSTQVIEYGDKLILPGLIDSHMHMGQAMDFLDESYCIDIGSARTFPEIMERMQQYSKLYPDNPVVFATNFNYFNLDEYFIPTATAMDAYFPDKPAVILTWEIHTFYANTKAIELAGITKDTPDPNGGIEKDANGELTGAFNDTAAFALQKIVQRPAEERKGSLVNFMNILNQYGITSVADLYPCGTETPYALYKSMEDQLSVRIHFYPELLSFTPEDIPQYKSEFNSPMLQFSGLKNLIDGVISVHTAWMSEPYFDDPTTSGYPAVSPEAVRAKMLEALGMGVNVRIHAIGDQAVTYVLDVFEEAEQQYGKPARRNVMEHLEYVRDEDVERIARLGVVADMQGRHITFYVDDGEPIMGERSKLAFRWRDIYDAGAVIGTGSDYPVVHFSPARCIYAAVTRQLEDGHPKGGWYPKQRMTLPEVLKIYTMGSACAINRENDLGSLEAGKLADVVVLDRNLFEVPEEELLEFMPVMTMVKGKVVFEK